MGSLCLRSWASGLSRETEALPCMRQIVDYLGDVCFSSHTSFPDPAPRPTLSLMANCHKGSNLVFACFYTRVESRGKGVLPHTSISS